MKGSKTHELEADVPAAELWKIYGTLRFVELVHKLLPQVLYKVEVVSGVGGVGTVIKVTLALGEVDFRWSRCLTIRLVKQIYSKYIR
jgi:hypothetical protein